MQTRKASHRSDAAGYVNKLFAPNAHENTRTMTGTARLCVLHIRFRIGRIA